MSHPTANPAQPGPTPERFFNIINGFHQAAALSSAVELALFTAIAEGHNTADKLASRCQASARGMRILADYLTVLGFLEKRDDTYKLAEDAALFLDKNSPAYIGASVEFLQAPKMKENFEKLTDRVRAGGAPADNQNVLAENHEVWVRFARGMAGLMTLPAEMLAQQLLAAPLGKAPMKVLDIAAGHGMFGIAVAQQNPNAHVIGLDWANVLVVAKENAAKFGVAARYATIAGDAFNADFGTGYDLVLVPNFLHHIDAPTNVRLLKKIHACLKPGGRVAVLEFAPNDDRVSPPAAATFALIMLAGTPAGDAFTVTELKHMLTAAGFADPKWNDLPGGMERVISGTKA